MSPARRARANGNIEKRLHGLSSGDSAARLASITGWTLPDIRIVLVEPSHPGNIGAVARAMKNMALTRAGAGAPAAVPAPGRDRARLGGRRRAGAGTRGRHARARRSPAAASWRRPPRASATSTSASSTCAHAAARLRRRGERRAPAAVVFGAERTGLTNEELELAHLLIRIPANDAYPSLNLAMAVQLVAYELFRARRGRRPRPQPLGRAAGQRRGHGAPVTRTSQQVLEEVDFRDRTQSGTHLMTRIRRLLQRAELDQNEVNILRGILTAVQERRRPPAGARAVSAAAVPRLRRHHAGGRARGARDGRVPRRSPATRSATPPRRTPLAPPAARRVERGTRRRWPRCSGPTPAEIVFTSGATESNNLALLGVARGARRARPARRELAHRAQVGARSLPAAREARASA